MIKTQADVATEVNSAAHQTWDRFKSTFSTISDAQSLKAQLAGHGERLRSGTITAVTAVRDGVHGHAENIKNTIEGALTAFDEDLGRFAAAEQELPRRSAPPPQQIQMRSCPASTSPPIPITPHEDLENPVERPSLAHPPPPPSSSFEQHRVTVETQPVRDAANDPLRQIHQYTAQTVRDAENTAQQVAGGAGTYHDSYDVEMGMGPLGEGLSGFVPRSVDMERAGEENRGSVQRQHSEPVTFTDTAREFFGLSPRSRPPVQYSMSLPETSVMEMHKGDQKPKLRISLKPRATDKASSMHRRGSGPTGTANKKIRPAHIKRLRAHLAQQQQQCIVS